MKIICPYCDKLTVEAIHHKAHMGTRIERISNKRSVVNFSVPEWFEPMGNCESCGKTKKEINDMILGNVSNETHEERVQRLKESGIPTRIENVRD